MLIPRYWSEAVVEGKKGRRLITLRRFGWSDQSREAAQVHAQQRAQEALSRAMTGEFTARAERRLAYNGAEGLPIREEIVEQRGDAVLTRNGYGAICLNAPNVLFADVDFNSSQEGGGSLLRQLPLLVMILGPLSLGLGNLWGWVVAVTSLCVWLVLRPRRDVTKKPDRAYRRVRRLAAKWVTSHSGWALRLYRTPLGVRLVALHRRFEPDEAEVGEFFSALGADPTYVRMCRSQKCFRARLTAKPWRIGQSQHLERLPATWPDAEPGWLERRSRWIEQYDRRARDYAACRFVEDLGQGWVSPELRKVIDWHDERSGALSSLPLA